MALSKEQIAYLDNMPDDLFVCYLNALYGERVPVWEECTEEEYVKYVGTYGIDHWVLTYDDLIKAQENLFSNRRYKCEPIYKDFKGGILNWLGLLDKKPDGYRFYKMVAEEPTLMLGSDMFEYCQTRECVMEYFKASGSKIRQPDTDAATANTELA